MTTKSLKEATLEEIAGELNRRKKYAILYVLDKDEGAAILYTRFEAPPGYAEEMALRHTQHLTWCLYDLYLRASAPEKTHGPRRWEAHPDFKITKNDILVPKAARSESN